MAGVLSEAIEKFLKALEAEISLSKLKKAEPSDKGNIGSARLMMDLAEANYVSDIDSVSEHVGEAI